MTKQIIVQDFRNHFTEDRYPWNAFKHKISLRLKHTGLNPGTGLNLHLFAGVKINCKFVLLLCSTFLPGKDYPINHTTDSKALKQKWPVQEGNRYEKLT